MRKVLAIETSCDETSVSVVSNHEYNYTIHSNIVASQIKDHSKWGGVVPELAARKHLELIPNVLNKALESANLDFNESFDADNELIMVGNYGPYNPSEVLFSVEQSAYKQELQNYKLNISSLVDKYSNLLDS